MEAEWFNILSNKKPHNIYYVAFQFNNEKLVKHITNTNLCANIVLSIIEGWT